VYKISENRKLQLEQKLELQNYTKHVRLQNFTSSLCYLMTNPGLCVEVTKIMLPWWHT